MCAVHSDRRAELVCTRCGTYGCRDCAFSTIPGKEICRACAAAGLSAPLPWEQRKQIGWWRAFWHTTKLVMSEPSATFRTPPTEDGLVGPLFYAAVAYTIGQMIVMLIVLLMMLTMGIGMAVATEEPAIGAIMAGYGVCLIPLTLLQAPVYALIGVLVSGSLGHATLAIFGRTTAPFDRSLRAVAYANAPHVLDIVSCVTPFWVIAAETIALREVHRCSTGVAFVAVAGWRLLFFLLIVGAYVGLVALVVLSQPS